MELIQAIRSIQTDPPPPVKKKVDRGNNGSPATVQNAAEMKMNLA